MILFVSQNSFLALIPVPYICWIGRGAMAAWNGRSSSSILGESNTRQDILYWIKSYICNFSQENSVFAWMHFLKEGMNSCWARNFLWSRRFAYHSIFGEKNTSFSLRPFWAFFKRYLTKVRAIFDAYISRSHGDCGNLNLPRFFLFVSILGELVMTSLLTKIVMRKGSSFKYL